MVKSLRERIYKKIRDKITNGNLSAGERRIESNLANEFHVSRSPIREALGQLKSEGLIIFERNKGIRVSKLSVKQVAWYFRNELADNESEANPGGLRHFGRQVVAEMNRLNMVIDVSHLSESYVMDILDITQDPIMASHSNAKAIYDHNRNLSDEAIKGIAQKDGVVGAVFFPPLVSAGAPPTMDDVIDHIDNFRNLIGVNHIALGSDYIHYAVELMLGDFKAKSGNASPQIRFPSSLETVEELPNLIEGLKKRGYKREEIELIMGGNLLRLFQQVLK